MAETADSPVSSSPPPRSVAAIIASATISPICSVPAPISATNSDATQIPSTTPATSCSAFEPRSPCEAPRQITAAMAANAGRPSGSSRTAAHQAAVAATAVCRIGHIRPRRRSKNLTSIGSSETAASRAAVLHRASPTPRQMGGGVRPRGRRAGRPLGAPPNGGGLPAAAEVRDLRLLLLRLHALALRRRVRALAELDGQRLGRPVAGDLDLDGVAGLVLVDQRGQRGRVLDGLAAERGDHVADLQAAVRGRAAGRSRGHLGAGALP